MNAPATISSADVATVPIAIAGAGPVGLALALSLARAGIRTVVLERKAQLDAHSRATLIVPRSLQLFEKLGILQPFLAQGQRNDAITILNARTRERVLTFDFAHLADRTPTPFAIALSQDRTEAILLEAVTSSGLCEVVFGDAFERFDPLDDGVLVSSASGRRWKANFLLGADGAHSAVRGQLGWQLEGKTYPTRAVLADVRIAPEADHIDGWLADLEAPSFTIAIRFASGVWRIIEAAVPDHVTDDMLMARSQQLATRLFGPQAWRETLWTAAYRKHERRTPHFVSGRIALAGDAAHLNSPAGGQGLNAGLADVADLSTALVAAMADPNRAAVLLRDYENQRIQAFDNDIRDFTDKLETMESAPAWLRKVGLSMIGLIRALGIEERVATKLAMLDSI